MHGLKIVKEGANIPTANTDDIYVDTTRPIFKRFKEGTGEVAFVGVPAEQQMIVLEHNLGYPPMFLFWMDRSPGTNRQMVTNGSTELTAVPMDISASISSVNDKTLEIRATAFGGTPAAGKYGYNYYIYYDPISEVDA